MLKEGNILLPEKDKTKLGNFNSFGYHFINSPSNLLFQLKTIGLETQTSVTYNWYGMNRLNDQGHCIFQYTLSGFGFINIEGNVHKLEKGDAFLVQIPSDHNYYLPETSDRWEFIYIHLYGEGVVNEYKKLYDLFGNIMKFQPDSPVITYLWKVYWEACNNNILDGYQTSSIAYEFLMELYRSKTSTDDLKSENHANIIFNTVEYIKNNYNLQLNLDDLSKAAGISKFHFNRTFLKIMDTTPWNYLTKTRLEKSIQLMQFSSYNIDEISKLVGFSGSNYFSKVFRKFLGTSPAKFREEHFSIQISPSHME